MFSLEYPLLIITKKSIGLLSDLSDRNTCRFLNNQNVV